MGVNVQQTDSSAEGATSEIYLAAGEHVEVCDGALVVLDGVDGQRVALFAAGTWKAAQVED